MSKHIHTATAEVETHAAARDIFTRDKIGIDQLATDTAAEVARNMTSNLHKETGDKIIMRVSVKIEIERE